MPKKPPDKKVLTIIAPIGLTKWLKRHAFELGVSQNQLVVDLLTTFVIAAYDPSDATLTPQRVGARLPERPTDRWPGYLEALVFTLPPEEKNGSTQV